jgi:hypothetical protein
MKFGIDNIVRLEDLFYYCTVRNKMVSKSYKNMRIEL